MHWKTSAPERWDGGTAIVLAHGAGRGMNSPFMEFFHEALPKRGFLSVQFDFDYMAAWRKMPDPQPKMQALYRQVVREVTATHRPHALVIGGKSMGGRVASYIAADTEDVGGLAFLGYPLHPPGKPDRMRDAHLDSLGVPMLFLSGSRDTFARRNLLEGVVERLGHRATLIWIERGDHSLKVPGAGNAPLETAADAIQAWARRSELWGTPRSHR